MDPERDPWPSVDESTEPGCPYCHAQDGEDHQVHCPLFVPFCYSLCGRPAQRMVGGEWYCTKCAPKGRVKDRAA